MNSRAERDIKLLENHVILFWEFYSMDSFYQLNKIGINLFKIDVGLLHCC